MEISFIQMPNGTGKTTTLNLLRGAIGGPEFWGNHAARIKELRKSPDTSNGSFTLELSHNEKLLTIIQQFDFENGKVQYYTTKSGIIL